MSEKEKIGKRFSTEVKDLDLPQGEQIELAEILGEDILITKVAVLNNQFGDYAVIGFQRAGKDKDWTTLSSGMVVMRKLKEAQERGLLPLIGAITREKKYYNIN